MSNFRILKYEGCKKFLGEIRQDKPPTKKTLKSLFLADDRINEILVQKAISRKEQIQGMLCSEICVFHVLRKFGQLIFLGYS